MPNPEDDALSDALHWLKIAPESDRLQDVSFGKFADGTGCWWSMNLVTEVLNGEVRPSPEDGKKKMLAVIAAWREAFFEEGNAS
jgi:hypothetical protein